MYQLSIFELILSIFFAFVFVGIFYLQRIKDPIYYFGFSEIVYGFKTSISISSFFVKALVIFVFSIVVYLLTNSLEVVNFSVFLGSLLLVWPVIINPEQIDYRIAERRKLLLFIYFVFILLSIIISRIGVLFVITIAPLFLEYVKEWDKPTRIFNFIFDGVIFSILTFVFIKLTRILNKEVSFQPESSSDDNLEI